MTENYTKALQVWNAFAKYIKSQCATKCRAVDTQLMGVFLPPDDGGCVRYMPLPSFLEAGKFKLQRNASHLDLDENIEYSI